MTNYRVEKSLRVDSISFSGGGTINGVDGGDFLTDAEAAITYIPISDIDVPNGVAGLDGSGIIPGYATLDGGGKVPVSQLPDEALLDIEQTITASIGTIGIGATETITHSADPTLSRIVQVYSELTGLIDNSLDFDVVDEPDFIQEDDTKTEFVGGDLQLQAQYDVLLQNLWNLDGDFSDAVGGVTGTDVGGVTFNTGKLGQAAEFTGTTGKRIGLGTLDMSGASAMSISCWFNISTPAGDARLVSKASSTSEPDHLWMLSTTSGGTRLRFRLRTTSPTTTLVGTQPLSASTWHFGVATYDGATMRLYLDSVVDGVTAAKMGAVATNPTISAAIGNQPSGAGDVQFRGLIDQVTLWNKALSPAEISTLYNSGAGLTLGGFDTNGWYVTTGTNQLDTSTWNSLQSLSFGETLPANTDLRYLISVDNRVTWNYWTGAAWAAETLANIHTNGNTGATLIGLSPANFALLFTVGTLDFAIGLDTSDATATPAITQITVTYDMIGSLRLSDASVEIRLRTATTTDVKNVSGGTIGPIRTNIVIPQA